MLIKLCISGAIKELNIELDSLPRIKEYIYFEGKTYLVTQVIHNIETNSVFISLSCEI